jgi:signal transduction histidine kinase/CheY-like chemotaxis protein
MRLRTALLLLVLATAIPLLVFALLASALVVKHQQDNFVTAVKDRNRAFMSAVDAELKGTIVTLQALTAAPSLQTDDLARFYRTATDTLATQPNWLSIILLKPDGEQVVNTMAPWGAPLYRTARQPASQLQAVRTLKPAVGGVIFGDGTFTKAPGIPVRVPVLRAGKLVYVLTAVVNPVSFQPLIEQQRLPAGWVSGLVDADGKFVARVPAKPVGSPASADYLAAVKAAPEGWYRGETVEGLDTYTAHVRSDLSGWSVGFAIPSELVLGGAKRAAWIMGGGVVFSLALALAIAAWLSNRIASPIDAELRRSAERFRLSQESALQGYTLFKAVRDAAGRVVDLEYEYINPAGAALGRTKPEALVGRRLKEMFPGTETTGLGAQLRRVAETGEPLDTELHYVADGVEGWYRHMAVKIGDGVGTSYIDISATKLLERELKERAEVLARADRNKSEFLAMLSHELRNPLAPLVNGLALLKAGAERGSGARAIEMMERQLRQLVRLIDDLLDISRIDRGKLDLRPERLAADAIVRSAVEIARPNIEMRRHELVLHFPGEPVYVEADPVRMAQVLSNVLNNAAKFTPPGGHIELTLKRQGEHALFVVADNGIGLAAGDRERNFDMFVQLDPRRVQAAGGLGVGLTLARTIVSRHGGKIWAESEGPEKGTQITIRLPLAPAPLARPVLRPVARDGGRSRRVLVVDDNVDAATSLATMLEFAGHEVRTVFSGSDVVAAAEEFRPECVLLDLNLPGVDGVEVGRRLRALPWGREAALIALTGLGQPADHARTAQAGFDHHLTKPVQPNDVLDLVARKVRIRG